MSESAGHRYKTYIKLRIEDSGLQIGYLILEFNQLE